VPRLPSDLPRESSAQQPVSLPKKLLLFRPALTDGGADRVTVTLLHYLNPQNFACSLALMRREGPLVAEVPRHVPTYDLKVGQLRYASLRLAGLIRDLSPDAVLSTSSGGNLVVSLAHWLSARSECSLVLSERNTYSKARQKLPPWLPVTTVKSFLYRRADLIVAVSRGVAADLERVLGLPSGLVKVIYNPVVDSNLLARANEPIEHPWFQEDRPIILAVGRLVPQKDYPTLLRAFAGLRRSHPCRLVILGEGPLRQSLAGLCEDLGIAQDVQFMGFVPNPFPYMRHCTVFVLSSQYEGLPGALIQAMACGAAVVATDCDSGPREVIEHGVNGLLVPVGDPEALQGAVSRILDDPAVRTRLRGHARLRARWFDASRMVRRYEEALEIAVSARKARNLRGVHSYSR
jgi:glycosyltransferase involved in cell wall biosynthesis